MFLVSTVRADLSCRNDFLRDFIIWFLDRCHGIHAVYMSDRGCTVRGPKSHSTMQSGSTKISSGRTKFSYRPFSEGQIFHNFHHIQIFQRFGSTWTDYTASYMCLLTKATGCEYLRPHAAIIAVSCVHCQGHTETYCYSNS